MKIQKYKNKPKEIEAVQFTDPGQFPMLVKWIGKENIYLQNNNDLDFRISFMSIEGSVFANIGDYIIKGIEGEFYPCKESIFEKTYELK